MTPEYWNKHPGRNPAHRFGKGRDRWQQEVKDPLTGVVRSITILGPKNPNRWLPHQGAKQRARYARQSAAKQPC